MPETWTLPLLAVGGGLLAVGLLWLLVVAFRTGFLKKAILPVLLIVAGVVVAGFIPVHNRMYPPPLQDTAQVFGDSITITGAKKDQLGVVMGHKGWKTIQAANAGLTDGEAAGLGGMADLGFLDLNDNPVTDDTLERLVKLPKLTKLYIARTKITPDGVRRLILENPESKVSEIDVTGLDVPGKAVRDWKNADKSRKANQ